LAAELRGDGATADSLAYGRSPGAYRCSHLVSIPDDFDYAVALLRQFFLDQLDALRAQRLSLSSEPTLAAIGRRIAAEERIHDEHGRSWLARLGGGGTAESRQRMQAALEKIEPALFDLCEPADGMESIEQSGVYPPLKGPMDVLWRGRVDSVFVDTGMQIDVPVVPPVGKRGGRRGAAPIGLKDLLDEMCEVYRSESGAAW
jgi:phenylacetate-CoA oxygenase PaaI subunit